MKLVAFLSILSIAFLLSCSQESQIKASISSLGNDTIYIENYKVSNIDNEPIVDTVYSKNGNFFYSTQINEPTICIITPKKSQFYRLDKQLFRPDSKTILLILEPNDKVSIEGKLDYYSIEYNTKGSLINQSLSTFREKYHALEIEKAKIELQLDTLMYNNGNQ